MSEQRSVTFRAIFSKATTTVDGGWNVTFSLAEHDGETVARIAELRDRTLQVAVVEVPEDDS